MKKKMDSPLKEPKLNVFDMGTFDQSIEDWENEMVDDIPIRGTRPLSDIYQRCNVVVYEPTNYKEAKTDLNLINATKDERSMIKKKIKHGSWLSDPKIER